MSQQAESDIQAVREQIDPDTLTQADDLGIDTNDIIRGKLDQHDGYKARTIANLATADLRNLIEAEQAEQIRGIIMGSRDRYGTRWPRRHSIIRSNGDHIEASTWGGSVSGPGGSEISIPTGGAKVQARVTFDNEHESYELNAIEAAEEFSHAELVDALGKIARSPGEIAAGDEYDIVVVKGSLGWANTQTIFEDGEAADEGQVFMTDENDDLQYHIELGLVGEDNTTVRAHFERLRYARTFVDHTEFDRVMHDAYQLKDTAETQAKFVGQALRGSEVFVIGNVNSYDQNRRDGEVMNYVDIAVTAMVSADPEHQQGLDEVQAETDDTDGQTETDEDTGDPEPADPPEPTDSPDAEDESGAEPVAAASEAVFSDINTYCELSGTDPASLTVEDVHENIKGVDASDVEIRAALSQFDDAEPDPIESNAPFDPSDETVDGIREAVETVGTEAEMISLIDAERDGKNRTTAIDAMESRLDALESGDDPDSDDDSDDASGCLAQASTTGELTSHIYDDHGATGDPTDWIASQLGVDDASFGDIENDDGMYECPADEV